MPPQNLSPHYPSRKFLELCLWNHGNFSPNQLRIEYPRFKRGAHKFVKAEAERLLMGPTLSLFLASTKRGIRPPSLDLRFQSVPSGSFEIMYDPQIREFVEILTLLSSTPKDIAQEMKTLPYVREFSENEIEGYCYFFWNNYEQDGWSINSRNKLKYILGQFPIATSYARHLKLGFGDLSRLKVAIELDLNCSPEIILEEAYRGFCKGVIKKSESILQNNSEVVDIWSKILLRDTQILRNMGWQPPSNMLNETIDVVQEDPSFLKSVTK
jgi:hypothetical protein